MSDKREIETVDNLPARCLDCDGDLLKIGGLMASNPPQQDYKCNECGNVYRVRVGQPQGHMADVAAAKAAPPARLTKEQFMAEVKALADANGYLLLPMVVGRSGAESPPEDWIPDTHKAVILVYEAQR